MNTAEHIVECYFRIVKECFTMNDAKVKGGVGRQLDILAVNMKTGEQYHIESSVTHRLGFAHKSVELEKIFKKKFLGFPEERPGAKTDFTLGKNYRKNIEKTYEAYGLDPKIIKRVFVSWILHRDTTADVFSKEFEQQHGIKISILNFRDEILPELQKAVGAANYDDEILRTMGFFNEREKQLKVKFRKSGT